MTTDLTDASVTPVGGSSAGTGRTSDVWGRRPIGLYRVTLTSSSPANGYTFDPRHFGFQGPIGAVYISPHQTVAAFQSATTGFGHRYTFAYDFVNNKIVVWDATDADEPVGDDLSLFILDVIVVGE